MYKSFFKLRDDPFSTSPDPRFLYRMPQTREAIAALEYSVKSHRGFMVITGEVGTGKTTLVRQALSSFASTGVLSAFVFNPYMSALELLEYILMDFGLVPESRTKAAMLHQLNRWLVSRFSNKQTCALVIDEAQNLSLELLEEIRLLTNLETSSQKLLQVVLTGQPELEGKLQLPQLRQLRQRVAVWCRTFPLSLEETQGYIEERLRIAGGEDKIFLPDAVREIFILSGGIPRLINLLCEHSLILAYVKEQLHIDRSTVQEIASDLELQTNTGRQLADVAR